MSDSSPLPAPKKFKRANRWDVQVAFPGGGAFGYKNLSQAERGGKPPLKPSDVVMELEDFLRRARRLIKRYKRRHKDADV